MNGKRKLVFLFTIISITALIFYCGDSKEKAEKEIKDEARLKLFAKNIVGEPISLLAVKYEINEDLLERILTDYEKMIGGFSLTEALANRTNKPQVSEEIIDVNTALNRVSKNMGFIRRF